MEKGNLTVETTITVKQAYLAMFQYIERYWNERQKPDEVGDLLSTLQLWESTEGKRPMNSFIFPEWLDCVHKVVADDSSEGGYNKANIYLT